MCPNTLSILGRSLRFGFNVNMLKEHTKLIATAIKDSTIHFGGNNNINMNIPHSYRQIAGFYV